MSLTSNNPVAKAVKWPINKGREIHRRIFSEEKFISSVKGGIYLAAAAVILAVIAIAVALFRPIPTVPDTLSDFNRYKRVEFVAGNFTEIWLTGTSADSDLVKAMLANPEVLPNQWSTEPLSVSDINIANITSTTDADSRVTEWAVTVGATLVIPGSDAPTRHYFRVTLLDTPGADLRALSGLSIVNHSRPNTTVQGAYSSPVSLTSTLGSTVANFAAAFYTSESGALGRYVSSGFDFAPIKSSPYTGTEIVSIDSTTPFPKDATEGDTLNLMVTVKATITLSTFTTLNVPLTARAIDNNQWQITDMPTFSFFQA